MKKGFTLLELLIVIGIMSMLGTISVNGYRAVVRGMEERSATSGARAFLRSARQRAQIDNKPIAIYWWNELLREETDDEPPIIVGKAIAVQQVGRFTDVDGNDLFDEFGDLNLGYPIATNTPTEKVTMRLYKFGSSKPEYAVFSSEVLESYAEGSESAFMKSKKEARKYKGEDPNRIPTYAFHRLKGNASFKAGDAYAKEFASITLPKGYIFGSAYSTSMSNPIKGEDGKVYTSPNPDDKHIFSVEIYSLRSTNRGKLEAKKVDTATDELKK